MVGPSSPREALEREIEKMQRVAHDANKRDPDGVRWHNDQRQVLWDDNVAAAVALLAVASGAVVGGIIDWWLGAALFAVIFVPYLLLRASRIRRVRRMRAAQLAAFEPQGSKSVTRRVTRPEERPGS